MKPKILVVDDEETHRGMIETVLSPEGYEISHAGDGQEAVQYVEERYYDLILMDIRMKKMDGISALKKIKEISPGIPVIIMTAYASINTAIDALKSGANDYLIKPLDIEELKLLVKKNLRHYQLEQENRFLKERLDEQFHFDNIIGKSSQMRKLIETIGLNFR